MLLAGPTQAVAERRRCRCRRIMLARQHRVSTALSLLSGVRRVPDGLSSEKSTQTNTPNVVHLDSHSGPRCSDATARPTQSLTRRFAVRAAPQITRPFVCHKQAAMAATTGRAHPLPLST